MRVLVGQRAALLLGTLSDKSIDMRAENCLPQ